LLLTKEARMDFDPHNRAPRNRSLYRARVAMALVVILVSLSVTAGAQKFDHAKICEAIQMGWELRIIYGPGEQPERVVIPRFLGYTSAGNVILNGLQVSGFSKSGNLPGHRSFRLDRMTDIRFTTTGPGPAGSGRLPRGVVQLICPDAARPR
jgi:hypothetical protein